MREPELLHALDSLLSGNLEELSAVLETQADDPLVDRLRTLAAELSNRERRRAQRLSAVKHEIANPLTIAQANLEAMIDGVAPTDSARLTRVLDAIEAAAALLSDITRLPRESEEQFEISIDTFNVCSLIEREALALESLADSKHVSFEYAKCGKSLTACSHFRGDERRVGQMLRNILLNAVRYTPPGGNIDVSCNAPDGLLTVLIRDTGIGVAPEEIERIFEPGVRGSRSSASTRGSGIGLSVVRELSDRIGARVTVVPKPQGTEFSLQLPMVPL